MQLAFCYVAPSLRSHPWSCRTLHYAVIEQIRCNGQAQPACSTNVFLHLEAFFARCTIARVLLWACKQQHAPWLLFAYRVESSGYGEDAMQSPRILSINQCQISQAAAGAMSILRPW